MTDSPGREHGPAGADPRPTPALCPARTEPAPARTGQPDPFSDTAYAPPPQGVVHRGAWEDPNLCIALGNAVFLGDNCSLHVLPHSHVHRGSSRLPLTGTLGSASASLGSASAPFQAEGTQRTLRTEHRHLPGREASGDRAS